MMKRMSTIIMVVVFGASFCRSEEIKGKLHFFVDGGVVAQKVKGGVLLWGRDAVAEGKNWRNADILVFLKLENTSGYKKGMGLGSGWLKYIGMHRHGNILVGYRDIPAYEYPSREEIEQAKYEEAQRQEQERLRQEAEYRKEAEQRRFDEEQRRIREQVEQEKIELELQKQREENARKLAAERAKAEAERTKAQLEAEKRREEEARRAEEERKRRYPIEQKAREEYASAKLSVLSFDYNSYVRIQRDLMRYIYRIEVTERKWKDLKNFQSSKNWLGMLGKMADKSMEDYPDKNEINTLIEQLCSSKFHLQIELTHKIPITSGRAGDGWNLKDRYSSGDYLLTFNMMGAGRNRDAIVIYDSDTDKSFGRVIDSINCKAHEKEHKLRKDMELGRIDRQQYDIAIKQVWEERMREFWARLDTTPVNAEGAKKIVGRDKARPTDVRTSQLEINASGNKLSASLRLMTCPDCGGSRYISKGQCDKCGGVGKYRTPITYGIGGRSMGGRETKCTKCSGNGEIKEVCQRCRGYGKIKQ